MYTSHKLEDKERLCFEDSPARAPNLEKTATENKFKCVAKKGQPREFDLGCRLSKAGGVARRKHPPELPTRIILVVIVAATRRSGGGVLAVVVAHVLIATAAAARPADHQRRALLVIAPRRNVDLFRHALVRATVTPLSAPLSAAAVRGGCRFAVIVIVLPRHFHGGLLESRFPLDNGRFGPDKDRAYR